MSLRFLGVITLCVAAGAVSADPVQFGGSVRLRGESWSWFDTPGYDDAYTFVGALIRASASQQQPRYDWQAELALPALLALPERAVAPVPLGQLGFGGTYAAANDGDSNPVGLFVKQAFFRSKWPGHTLRAGRFEFIDGNEVAPENPVLAAVKSQRVAHRLIGNFGFTHVGRSFDGVHYVHSRPDLNFTAAALRPTVGAFDVEGMPPIDDVTLLYASGTWSQPHIDARAFVIGYNDDRAADPIDVTTVGGHYLTVLGPWNLLAWAAWQTGDWRSLEHNATAIDLEVAYRIGGTFDPSIRGGIFRSSGDDDPTDGDHGTFFQIIPTARVYARFPFYNAMNSTDVFVQLAMKPLPKLSLSTEIHRLQLTDPADLWYAGGGVFEEETFGFAGRPSNGQDSLALVADLNVEYALAPRTALTFYVAAARGGGVIDSIYAGRFGMMAYVEVLQRF